MKRKWKITWAVLAPLTVFWLAEPFITEWYYKEKCSFGSVSKNEYAAIRSRAQKISKNWDWSKKAYQAPNITGKSAPTIIWGRYLTAFLDANLVKFIPEKAPIDVKIAHVLAFMEGIGMRMYSNGSSKGYYISKGQKPVVSIGYVIYKMKLGRYSPILLAPKSRFFKISLNLQEGTSGNGIVKRAVVWPAGFLTIPLDDGGRWESFKPLGCLEKELFMSWGLS